MIIAKVNSYFQAICTAKNYYYKAKDELDITITNIVAYYIMSTNTKSSEDGGQLMTKLVTPIEAAAALKVDRMTIYRWIKRGRLPVRRLPSGLIRIKAEDVENLLTQCGS